MRASLALAPAWLLQVGGCHGSQAETPQSPLCKPTGTNKSEAVRGGGLGYPQGHPRTCNLVGGKLPN